MGTYQLKFIPSYIQDIQQRDTMQLKSTHYENFVKLRIFSTFRNAVKHYMFIEFNNRYYCLCKSGAGTVGRFPHMQVIYSTLNNLDMGSAYSNHQSIYCSTYSILQIGMMAQMA